MKTKKTIQYYKKQGFDYFQMCRIKEGLEKDLDVSKFAKKEFNNDQMQQILIGLKQKIDVSKFADKNFNWEKMFEIRSGLLKKQNVKQNGKHIKNLKKYRKCLLEAQAFERDKKARPDISRVEIKKDDFDCCQTLWIPTLSGNRTAAINLNHNIGDFDEDGNLWGFNGNCLTPYIILEIPKHWIDDDVARLAMLVCQKMDKPKDYPFYRVLKADERIIIIRDCIDELNN